MNKIAALGCIICERFLKIDGSPACLHHVRDGIGIAQRDHDKILPLCPNHHKDGGYGVAIHDGKEEWERNFCPEIELLAIIDGMEIL